MYDLRLYQKDLKSIRTIVIYSGDIKDENVKTELRIGPNAYYKLETIFMNKFNGNSTLEELQKKIYSENKLSELDRLNLIFLPLMNSSLGKNEMAITAIELAKEIEDKEQRMFCMSAIIGISDKFIDEDYINKLKGVFEMTKIGYLLKEEGKTEGKTEGKAEALLKVLKVFLGATPSEYIEKINKASGEVVENILDNIKEITNYKDIDRFLK